MERRGPWRPNGESYWVLVFEGTSRVVSPRLPAILEVLVQKLRPWHRFPRVRGRTGRRDPISSWTRRRFGAVSDLRRTSATLLRFGTGRTVAEVPSRTPVQNAPFKGGAHHGECS